ncbi:apolipoprotein N-acyltransferase [Gammaproteobacteria bacterium]|nr:apolipoprotein N-acyltransferase [Gammaproteobacteria bacterium]
MTKASSELSAPGPEFRPGIFTRCFIALLGGAAGPLAFSPNNMWLLGFVSVMGLYIALKYATPRQGAITGWFFGLGFFGLGASWVFVSINVYGNASEFLAGLLTLFFVAGLALLFALQGWLSQRFFNCSFYIFSFAALWVLGEWTRSWFLTGFPWLYLGYPHTQSSFAGIAPLFGVFGISLIVALSGAGFGEMVLIWNRHTERKAFNVARSLIPTALFFLWIFANLSGKISWVDPVEDAVIKVGLVQANIEQGQKFDNAFIQQNLDHYDALSTSLWQADVIVWPETAIPLVAGRAGPTLDYFSAKASRNEATLITGIFGESDAGLHNSITSIGNGEGIYHKQKLVPFGEYVPMRAVLSTLLQIFNLPMSSLEKGPSDQGLLTAGQYSVSPYICYEVVYPDFVRQRAKDADFLVTISNDTWFGASWGPLQHLEMAAMRALENGRYMVRATNNGVSAIINEKGEILARTEQFQAEVLLGEVQVFSGRTPFSYWGSWPILLLCAALLCFVHLSPEPALKLLERIRNR